MASRTRAPNLTNVLVYVGCAALVATMWMPGASADRTARIETRAEEAGRALLDVGVAAEPLDFGDAEQIAALDEAFQTACKERFGHPSSYLPQLRVRPPQLDGEDCVCFESKHYCFLIGRREKGAPLEVYAWPQELRPPGRTAFFFPQNGRPAFTRNLIHQYVGWDEDRGEGRAIPRPGDGLPRRAFEARDYRGKDDERWILLN